MDYSSITILNMLGKGVYSQVFYGKLGNQEFAVKKFRSEKKYKLSTSREILINEMLMNSEDRPVNIIKSFGSFFDKTYFLVFELQNLNLFNFIKFYKEDFDSELVLKIGKQITTGLSFLHKDFIHCDLKPENIMIYKNQAILIDFGFAKILNTKTKTYCGTFEYMAPEIKNNQSYSFPVDMYAFGVLLYEMYTNQLPFTSCLYIPYELSICISNLLSYNSFDRKTAIALRWSYFFASIDFDLFESIN